MSVFRVLGEQLTKLNKLRDESIFRKVADFEYEKGCIAEVLEKIDEARIQFEVCESTQQRGRHPHVCCGSWP